jgi:hypothetical protein
VTNTSEPRAEDVYQGGFVAGLLTARYYALRHPLNGETFGRGAPSEVPTIVYLILSGYPAP